MTTDRENIASQAVIRANGGHPVEQVREHRAYGGGEALRFRVALPSGPPTLRDAVRVANRCLHNPR